MSDLIPMTRIGYDKVKAEVDHLEQVRNAENHPRTSPMPGPRDLSENADCHRISGNHKACCRPKSTCCATSWPAARLSILQKRPAIRSSVVVKDLNFGDEETFVLVGAGEEDYDASFSSPSPLPTPGADGGGETTAR